MAEDAVEKNSNIKLKDMIDGGALPPSVMQSILLLVGNLYNNRDTTTYSSINEVPYTYKYLINLNRNFDVM
ncbi:head-tail connector protein [Prevotella sp.]|uniref:head-tail connector protein n=1 Tax=Prevotella sp. TaxID=59823 RepID=UPI002F9310B9